MTVYRLCRTKHAHDLSGEGPRLFGGRWNHKGVPCVYTAENRSLAILEYSVNISEDEIPRALSILSVEIPEHHILEVHMDALPGNWHHVPAPLSAKNFGTALLEKLQYPVIKIPSAVIPQEFNYILNPLHADAKLFRVINVYDFVYDLRIKMS